MVPEWFNVNYQILTVRLEYLPSVLAADAHDSKSQLKTAEVITEHALNPVLRHHLGRLGILFEANLGKNWLVKGKIF